MATARAIVFAVLLGACVGTVLSACPTVPDETSNNWPENKTGVMRTVLVQPDSGVINVTMNKRDTEDDASPYVKVYYNDAEGGISFEALPTMAGVMDYPKSISTLVGNCIVECESEQTTSFTFTAYLKDMNTADPRFNQTSYTTHVTEVLPTGLVVSGLTISASDADADKPNNVVSFSLNDTSVFSLSSAVQTADEEATYTAQLVLVAPLNYSKTSVHYLSVVAEDGGGRQTTAELTVFVDDVDNMQPDFTQMFYTADVDDPETPGPLNVSILATDPDTGGELQYKLMDTTAESWTDFFSIDPNTAVVSLAQPISDRLSPYERTITFIVQADESEGPFYCRAALSITLPAQTTTTTTEMPTSTVTSPLTSGSTTEMSTSTVTSPMTSPSTTETSTATSPSTTEMSSSTVTSPSTTDVSTSTVTSPMTSPSTTEMSTSTVTSPATTTETSTSGSTTSSAPSTTPAPCALQLFSHRQFRANVTESFTGIVTRLSANPAAGDVTFAVLTPGYEDSFALNETSGVLTKKKKLGHQRVSLLVQGIPPGGEQRNQTNNTDIVELDETLVIVDVTDENDSPPVLDCQPYSDSCDAVVVGYPSSKTVALPTPLLRLTATDSDTGEFGTDGIGYTVDSEYFKMDASGMLYLVAQPPGRSTVVVTATDNHGNQPFLNGTAHITMVPVEDDHVFYISTSKQLADVGSALALLNEIRKAGGYQAVFALDLQPLGSGNQPLARDHMIADSSSSKLYIYALQKSGSAFSAVGQDDMKKVLDGHAELGDITYIETKHDQINGGGGTSSSANTALIVAVAVLGVLLVVVVVAAVLRQRRILQRFSRQNNYVRHSDDAETSSGGPKHFSYSPPSQRRESVISPSPAFENRAYETEQVQAEALRRESDVMAPPLDLMPVMDPPIVDPLPPIRAPTPPRADTPPPIRAPTPPRADTPPPIRAPTPPPTEPKPDYALKSVGFKETVLCVVPDDVIEEDPAEEQADADDEGGHDSDEPGEGAAAEEAETEKAARSEEPGERGSDLPAQGLYPRLDSAGPAAEEEESITMM